MDKLTYEEAAKLSLTKEWKVSICHQGKECWCRIIKTKNPIFYYETEEKEEYYIIGSGAINKDTAKHIVKVHNEKLKNNGNIMQ